MLHKSERFSIYFGNAQDRLTRSWYQAITKSALGGVEPFDRLYPLMEFDELIFLRQIHSIRGALACHDKAIFPFAQEGDYLVTPERRVGIGVMSADCLPIVAVDTMSGVAGIAHAGWRGATAGIIRTFVQELVAQGVCIEQLQVFLGPSAKLCCYQVSPDFKTHLPEGLDTDQFIVHRREASFFDLPGFCRQQLVGQGVPSALVHGAYNSCTIHNLNFCSSRRDQSDARQMTVVSLR